MIINKYNQLSYALNIKKKEGKKNKGEPAQHTLNGTTQSLYKDFVCFLLSRQEKSKSTQTN